MSENGQAARRSGQLLTATAVLLALAALTGLYTVFEAFTRTRDCRQDERTITLVASIEDAVGALATEVYYLHEPQPTDGGTLDAARQKTDQTFETLAGSIVEVELDASLEDPTRVVRAEHLLSDPLQVLADARASTGEYALMEDSASALLDLQRDLAELAKLSAGSVVNPALKSRAFRIASQELSEPSSPETTANPERAQEIDKLTASISSSRIEADGQLVTSSVLTLLMAAGALFFFILAARRRKQQRRDEALAADQSEESAAYPEAEDALVVAGLPPWSEIGPAAEVSLIPEVAAAHTAADAVPVPEVPEDAQNLPAASVDRTSAAPNVFGESYPPLVVPGTPHRPPAMAPGPRTGAGLAPFETAVHPATGAHEGSAPPAIPARLSSEAEPTCRLSEVLRRSALKAGEPHRFWVRSKADPELVPAVCSDLVDVLAPLMSDAVQFSPPGTRVNILTRQDNDGIWVEIQDEGCGFDPIQIPAINAALAMPGGIDWLGARGLITAARRVGNLGLALSLVANTTQPGMTATVLLPSRSPGGVTQVPPIS